MACSNISNLRSDLSYILIFRSFGYLILQQANQTDYIIFRTHFKPVTKWPNIAIIQ